MLMVDGVEMLPQLFHPLVEEEEFSPTLLTLLTLPIPLLLFQPLQLLIFTFNLIQEPLLVKKLLILPLPLLV